MTEEYPVESFVKSLYSLRLAMKPPEDTVRTSIIGFRHRTVRHQLGFRSTKPVSFLPEFADVPGCFHGFFESY